MTQASLFAAAPAADDDLLAILLAPAPPEPPDAKPAPPAPRVERNFYRCLDCLSVFAVDGKVIASLQCGACSGKTEHMGRVQRDRLVRDDFRCPCDDRCTTARGPNCECQCGGANHGSGLVVRVEVDAGGIPVAHMHDTTRAAFIANEYRQAISDAKDRLSWAYAIVRQKQETGWVQSFADLLTARAAITELSIAKGYINHKRRMAALAKVGAK